MIRFIWRILLFCLGLSLAALWFGQMHQLRQVAPAALPSWTQTISDESGLRNGTARIPSFSNGDDIEISWAFQGVNREGLNWDVSVDGQGIAGSGKATAPIWPIELRIVGRANVDIDGEITPINDILVILTKQSGQKALNADISAKDNLPDAIKNRFGTLVSGDNERLRVVLPITLTNTP